MQVLVGTVSDLHYAIATARTVEVIPLVNARPIPRSAAAVRGLINYRGHLIELIDMGVVLGGHPIEARMACRIVVVDVGDVGDASTVAATPRDEAVVARRVPAEHANPPTPNVPDAADDNAQRSGTQPALTGRRENKNRRRCVGVLMETLIGRADVCFTEPLPAEHPGYLGPMAVTQSGTIQLIFAERLPGV